MRVSLQPPRGWCWKHFERCWKHCARRVKLPHPRTGRARLPVCYSHTARKGVEATGKSITRRDIARVRTNHAHSQACSVAKAMLQRSLRPRPLPQYQSHAPLPSQWTTLAAHAGVYAERAGTRMVPMCCGEGWANARPPAQGLCAACPEI